MTKASELGSGLSGSHRLCTLVQAPAGWREIHVPNMPVVMVKREVRCCVDVLQQFHRKQSSCCHCPYPHTWPPSC